MAEEEYISNRNAPTFPLFTINRLSSSQFPSLRPYQLLQASPFTQPPVTFLEALHHLRAAQSDIRMPRQQAYPLTNCKSICICPTFFTNFPRGPSTVTVRAFKSTVTPSGTTKLSVEETSLILAYGLERIQSSGLSVGTSATEEGLRKAIKKQSLW